MQIKKGKLAILAGGGDLVLSSIKSCKTHNIKFLLIGIKEYYSLDSWQNYCQFLAAKSDLKKPKILKSQEWNEVGLDE